MHCIPRIFLALITLLTIGSALAEGRCPPGQYPVGGQGVGGCAPIPGGEGGAQAAPRPTGRWIKTWGAISVSPASGAVGVSVGQKKKSAAIDEAQTRCMTEGASDCHNLTAFKNQCVAFATDHKNKQARANTGASKDQATERVMGDCVKAGLDQCKVVYSDCAKPEFISY